MAKHYFALVNSENVVEQVIVGPEEYPEENDPGVGKQWVETFMNGQGGKNYAGIGHIYDPAIQDFLSPKPFPSWVQNGNQWEAPVAKPEGDWLWEESTGSWVEWVRPEGREE